MKNRMEYKTAGTLTQAGAPSIEELKQINAFTRRAFSPEEIYCFSVVLCDNDIDRMQTINDRKTLDESWQSRFVGKPNLGTTSLPSKNQRPLTKRS